MLTFVSLKQCISTYHVTYIPPCVFIRSPHLLLLNLNIPSPHPYVVSPAPPPFLPIKEGTIVFEGGPSSDCLPADVSQGVVNDNK